MSVLHIIYRGRTADVINESEHGLLERWIDMDNGRISYMIGRQMMGKSINPESELGKTLRSAADRWIRNPETRWISINRWFEPYSGRSYAPFYYEGPDLPKRKGFELMFWDYFVLGVLIIFFACAIYCQ